MKFAESKKFNIKAIPKLEKFIGFKLPLDYTGFVNKGVGIPSEENNTIYSKESGVSIDWFLDESQALEAINLIDGIEGFYPFGEDCFGNYYLLDKTGCVFFYSHDLKPIRGFKEQKEYSGIFFLFSTFSDYIKNLKPSGL